ncbi:MAG: PD-(D/E)XK nuclease family protein [Patescibacteria group bacterium]
MAPDKYTAVWVSHSSMGDFLKCPRAYFLHNIYRDPKDRRKITIASPALSLGSAVHEVVEGLANFPAEKRFNRDLLADFKHAWQKVSGKKGGFVSADEEAEYFKRGEAMVRRVAEHPGPLRNKTVKLKAGHNDMPPNFYLSEEDNIILCGKIDWLEYNEVDDSVRVLDFKTGKNDEDGESLQLPIYALLLNKLQKRKVSGAGYWYLDRDDEVKSVTLPDLTEAFEKVLTVAKKVKQAREKNEFVCPKGEKGCFACRPYEKIIRGEAELIGVGEYNQTVYMVR